MPHINPTVSKTCVLASLETHLFRCCWFCASAALFPSADSGVALCCAAAPQLHDLTAQWWARACTAELPVYRGVVYRSVGSSVRTDCALVRQVSCLLNTGVESAGSSLSVADVPVPPSPSVLFSSMSPPSQRVVNLWKLDRMWLESWTCLPYPRFRKINLPQSHRYMLSFGTGRHLVRSTLCWQSALLPASPVLFG